MKTGLTPEVNALSTIMVLITGIATTLYLRLTENRI